MQDSCSLSHIEQGLLYARNRVSIRVKVGSKVESDQKANIVSDLGFIAVRNTQISNKLY